jgi:WhiB family transcriptional regulator, redox-sensing transcriptional regulator
MRSVDRRQISPCPDQPVGYRCPITRSHPRAPSTSSCCPGPRRLPTWTTLWRSWIGGCEAASRSTTAIRRPQRNAETKERLIAVRWNPVVVGDDHDWRARAACRSVDANLFFPTGSTGPALAQLQAAKAFCRSCPVQRDCLEFALETNQEDGVWGGKDEIERRRLRREWRQSTKREGRRVGV